MDKLLTARLVIGLVLAAPFAALAGEASGEQDLVDCPPLVVEAGSTWDYRIRNAPERIWGFKDNQKNHYQPAIERMRAGDYTSPVIADLDFLLRKWPNHYAGLQALVAYELGGGKRYQFPSTECYFEHARQFAPDDANVYLVEGYYFWKKGEEQRAQKSWETALKIDPQSADAHYNLGLALFEMGQYDAAAQHAQAAYASGYPLPGLRKKLEKVGKWRDPSKVPEASR